MTDRSARLRWSSSNGLRRFAITILLTSLLLTGATFVAQNTVPVVTGDAHMDKPKPDDARGKNRAHPWRLRDPATNQGQAGYLVGVPRLVQQPAFFEDKKKLTIRLDE